jgi:predicted kinase
MSDAQLLLIRGLPGSGKSTLAKTKYPDGVHLEADMYFSRNGEYKFNPPELPKAHQWCQEETKKALDAGLKVVLPKEAIERMNSRWEAYHPGMEIK